MKKINDYICLLIILCLIGYNFILFHIQSFNISLFDLSFFFIIFFSIITFFTNLRVRINKFEFKIIVCFLILLAFQNVNLIVIQSNSLIFAIKTSVYHFFALVIFLRFYRVSSIRSITVIFEAMVWSITLTCLVSILNFDGGNRLDSLYWGRSNAFAAFLNFGIFISIQLILSFSRYYLTIPLLINIVGLLLTNSRGGILIFVLGVLLIFIMKISKKEILSRKLYISIFILFLIFSTAFFFIRKDFGRLANTFENEVTDQISFVKNPNQSNMRNVMSGRLFLWTSAIETIKKNLFLGSKNRPIYIPKWAGSSITEREGNMTYHNALLNITSEYGLIGLVLNLILLFLAVKPLFSKIYIDLKVLKILLSITLIHSMAEPIFERGFLAFNLIGIAFWATVGMSVKLKTLRTTL